MGIFQFGRKQIIDENTWIELIERWTAQNGFKVAPSLRLKALAEIMSYRAKHLQKI